MQEVHCPLPPGSEAVYCRRSTAHCPQAVRQCIAGDPLPPAPGHWGGVLQELRCPRPPGRGAVRRRGSTAHCPRQGGSVRQEYHCPLPPGNEAVRSEISDAHGPQAAWQCVTMPTALCPKQQYSRAHTVQYSAQHQAVQVLCTAPSSAAPHKQHRWCSAARRVQWTHETLCDCAQASAGQCRPSAQVHWSGYATTHLHTARTQHTQPSPFTCTRG